MASQLIPVRVGDIQIEVEAALVAGTEPTSGKTGRAAETVLEAFSRAQEAIIEVARSTAQMIDRAGAAARPDRLPRPCGKASTATPNGLDDLTATRDHLCRW